MIYFTSDTHYNDPEIISVHGRPFSSVDEMNGVLIENTNSLVEPSDQLFHLGDFCKKNKNPLKYLSQIRCKNVTLILGNHDKLIRKNLIYYKTFFSDIRDYLEIDFLRDGKKQKLVTSHYPFAVWFKCNSKKNPSWQVHGHTHNQFNEEYVLSTDVGVDCWEHKPVSLIQIWEVMEEKCTKISAYNKSLQK